MEKFTILFSIVAILTIIHLLRESYLSGFYSKNIIQVINIILLVLMYVTYTILKETIDIFMKNNGVFAISTICIILIILIVPSKLGNYILEKEKRKKIEKWKQWKIILSKTTWIQRNIFYYKVNKNQ